MVALVKLVGIAIVVMTIIFTVKADSLKQYINFWKKGKRIYVGTAITFIAGIVFLLAASQCRLPVVVAIIGIWSLAKGVILLVRGQEWLNGTMGWFEKQSAITLRIIMVVSLVVGALIIYAA